MSDLISRQAAIEALENDKAALDKIIKGMSAMDVRLDAYVSQRNQVVYDIDAIEQLPPIQPKRGKWIKYEQDFMLEGSLGTVQKTVRECSVCTAKIAGMVGIMNFCPNCGAKMEAPE